MAIHILGVIFASLFSTVASYVNIKSNLQSGYEASYARLQELAQDALKHLAEDPEVGAVDAEAKDAKANIPAEEDGWKAPADPWVIDTPKLEHIDEIFFGFPGDDSTNLVNPPQRGTLAFPKDSCPPAAGWPALLTIPGRKNRRSTMQYVADLLAGKGRVTLNIDMKDDARLKDLNAGIAHLKANNLTYNLNPFDISVFGYSLGAITLATAMQKDYVANQLSAVIVTSGASLGHLKAKLGLNWEEGQYYDEGIGYHAPPSLIIHCTDDGLVPFFAKKKQVPQEYVNYMKSAGLKAHGLFYDNGCYHHPFKNLGYFDQIDLFLKDPLTYESEVYADPAMYKAMMDNYALISDTKGCAYNDDGVEPFKAFEMFNQMDVCKAACYQAEGCVAFDWYSAFAFERPTGKENCFLYKEPCETPLYDVCTDKKRCPQSFKMMQPRSAFGYSPSLMQLTPKAVSIQRHHQRLRGSTGAEGQLKKVRTRRSPSCPEIEYEEENVTTVAENSKGLFVTLIAVDSAGCHFEFTEFGKKCERYRGKPTGITSAMTCETASAHLEGYSFSGEVSEEDKHNHPPGCFLKANSGEVKFNPSLEEVLNPEGYAFACQQCEVILEADIDLKYYEKASGDTTDASFCADEYKLGKYEIFNNKDCAAKCDDFAACTHFRLCTIPQEHCCQLSATCTTPYKNASSDWNGFLKLPRPTPATAVLNYTKTAGHLPGYTSCSATEYYTPAGFDTDDPAECAAKCEESMDCISFRICIDSSDASENCCRLSKVCTLPYTHSDPKYDSYMSNAAVDQADIALDSFQKKNGSNMENSYCTGAYDLALYDISSPAECAAKCLSRSDCTHFKLCKDDSSMCCALSSTCSLPYKTASRHYDGYLNLKLSRFKLAADSSPVVTSKVKFEKEPLCSPRTAEINLKNATLNTSYPDGGLLMKFMGVAKVEDEPVNLVISSKGTYTAGKGNKSRDGGNGIINLKLGTSVELTFQFQDSSGACVAFDEVHLTPLDINEESDASEIWEFYDIAGYVAKPDADIKTTEPDDTGDGYADLILESTSATAGWCGDKTIDAYNMRQISCENGTISYHEEKRAALVVYKRSCEIGVKLSAPGSPEDLPFGKEFMFTFGSELAELCD